MADIYRKPGLNKKKQVFSVYYEKTCFFANPANMPFCMKNSKYIGIIPIFCEDIAPPPGHAPVYYMQYNVIC